MKTNSKFSMVKTLLTSALLIFLLTSCDEEKETPMPNANSSEIIGVPFFVETEDKEMPSDASQLLFEIRNHKPVTAPDGHHLTWGEFSTLNGEISLQCTDQGVETTLQLTGLVPNGVYTIDIFPK